MSLSLECSPSGDEAGVVDSSRPLQDSPGARRNQCVQVLHFSTAVDECMVGQELAVAFDGHLADHKSRAVDTLATAVSAATGIDVLHHAVGIDESVSTDIAFQIRLARNVPDR